MDSLIEEKRKQSKSYKTIKYDRFPLTFEKRKDIIGTRIMSELT